MKIKRTAAIMAVFGLVAGALPAQTTGSTTAASSAAPQAAMVDSSVLTTVGTTQPAVLGFAIEGTGTRRVLLRAVSAGLAGMGIASPPIDTMLQVYQNGQLIAVNNNWGTPIAVGNTSSGITSGTTVPAGTMEPASLGTPAGAGTTATIPMTGTGATGTGTTTGTQTAATGTTSASVDTAADQATIASVAAGIGAIPLVSGSTDSALILDLPPGAYTAMVTNAAMTTGASLLETTTTGSVAGIAKTGTATGAGSVAGTGTTTVTGTTTAAGVGAASTANSGTVLIEVYLLN